MRERTTASPLTEVKKGRITRGKRSGKRGLWEKKEKSFLTYHEDGGKGRSWKQDGVPKKK